MVIFIGPTKEAECLLRALRIAADVLETMADLDAMDRTLKILERAEIAHNKQDLKQSADT